MNIFMSINCVYSVGPWVARARVTVSKLDDVKGWMPQRRHGGDILFVCSSSGVNVVAT